MTRIPGNLEIRPESLAIVGWDDGGAGQIHSWLTSGVNGHVACFVHVQDTPPEVDVRVERSKRDSSLIEFPEQTSFKGTPLISSSRWLEVLKDLGIGRVLVLLPDKRQRWEALQAVDRAGLELPSIVHPTAVILDEARLAPNTVIHAAAVVGYRAEIGPGVAINTGAHIDHHNVVRECAMIDPGVVTAGHVTVGAMAHIHTGAVIINRIRIGREAVVAAGAVVVRDVPVGERVAGVPARPMRPKSGGTQSQGSSNDHHE